MRWSQTLIPTLKEAPADAEIVSHQLLLRAGLCRKLTGGLYTFCPMGLRVLRKIERIIREEMDRAGALEVLMPALQPPDIWQKSGRYETARDVLYKAKDRSNKEWVLSPTAEEVITTLASTEINSYRQLPLNFYQISVKFRDEIRPRFGLMRAKEFIMKDAYSFDGTDEGAMASYRKMYDAYSRIFARCGLQAFPVEADTGVIGGNYSHEFMVPAETGENEVVYCESGQYSANVEKATSRGPLTPTPTTTTGAAPEKFATPGVVTIDALAAAPYGVSAASQVKTLIYLADNKPVIILVRGDDQLNEAKLAGKLGATAFRPATADEILAVMGARPGSLGAVTATRKALDIRVFADEQLRQARGMTTGANEDGFHLRHVDVERDIKVDVWADLRTVVAGELCVTTGLPLKIRRAIEVGHVFKLGTKYSEKLESSFLDTDGQRRPTVMGCYGIGVTRTLQAVIEQCHDKDGILWPMSVAPYQVLLTPLGAPGTPTAVLAQEYYVQLQAAGVEVLIDDRDERPGFKFKDADLIGIPLRVSIGEKSLAKGEVELKPRGGALRAVPKDKAVDEVLAFVRESLSKLA
ncbi:MAG: proline--tRNA ligase [Verrucomicrobiales bacterium]|nr:proline--tRNA ligase [Verrucomicrobiales bacterium]